MAEDLLSIFPTWKDHLAIAADAGAHCFKIQVLAPAASQGGPLEIASFNQDVTVFYATTHRHFFTVLGNADEAGGAIEFIRKIFDEQLVVVSYLCTGDSIIRDGVFASVTVPADRIPRANHEYYYASSMRVRSWKGTFDTDFAAPYARDKPATDNARRA